QVSHNSPYRSVMNVSPTSPQRSQITLLLALHGIISLTLPSCQGRRTWLHKGGLHTPGGGITAGVSRLRCRWNAGAVAGGSLKSPLGKCCSLALLLTRGIDQIPDDGVFDQESSPGLGDAHATIIAEVSLGGCRLQHAGTLGLSQGFRSLAGGSSGKLRPVHGPEVQSDAVAIIENRICFAAVRDYHEG